MVAAAARFPQLIRTTRLPLEMPVPLYSEGELVIATAMSLMGFWHAFCRNREALSATFCGTRDTRAQLVADIAADIKVTAGQRQPDDYLIFLMPHNHFFSAERDDEDLPYFSRPFDPAFVEKELHDAPMFAQAEAGKGSCRAEVAVKRLLEDTVAWMDEQSRESNP